MILYGIPNCDTVKKAMTWLKENNFSFEFHDFKKQGISNSKLIQWSQQVGWDKLLNKKSTTWRAITPEKQAAIINERAAIQLMLEASSIIKRPVLEVGQKLIVGFNIDAYQNIES